jgi:hypothetical protein
VVAFLRHARNWIAYAAAGVAGASTRLEQRLRETKPANQQNSSSGAHGTELPVPTQKSTQEQPVTTDLDRKPSGKVPIWKELNWNERITIGLAFVSLVIAGLGYKNSVSAEDAANAIAQLTKVALAQQDEVSGIANETQAIDNEASAAANQANSTAALVGPAGATAAAATSQAKYAGESFRSESRAWIAPIGVDAPQAAVGVKVIASMFYENTGKMPALDLQISQIMQYVPNTHVPPDWWFAPLEPIPICVSRQLARGGSTVYPTTKANYNTSIPPRDDFTYHQELVDKAKILVWEGCFRYRTLETVHISRFCEFLRPRDTPIEQWMWEPCVTGNYAD